MGWIQVNVHHLLGFGVFLLLLGEVSAKSAI